MNDQSKLSCCNICLLAYNMKSCQSCPFNPSKLKLSEQDKQTVVHKELLKEHKS